MKYNTVKHFHFEHSTDSDHPVICQQKPLAGSMHMYGSAIVDSFSLLFLVLLINLIYPFIMAFKII